VGNLPAYSTTVFSTDGARPPCRPPCTTGYYLQARERSRGSLGLVGRPHARREELLAMAAKTDANVWDDCHGTIATLWHTRRRGGGAVAGRDAGTQEGTTRTVVQCETAAPHRAIQHADAGWPSLLTHGSEEGTPPAQDQTRAVWHPRASDLGWGCDIPGAVRRRTRRRLPGGHGPGQWEVGLQKVADAGGLSGSPHRAASHYHGMLTSPLAAAMVAREIAAPHAASTPDRCVQRPSPVCRGATAWVTPCRWWPRAQPEPGASSREGARNGGRPATKRAAGVTPLHVYTRG
jgi:hypothetical protein